MSPPVPPRLPRLSTDGLRRCARTGFGGPEPFDERVFLFYEVMNLCLRVRAAEIPAVRGPDLAARAVGVAPERAVLWGQLARP